MRPAPILAAMCLMALGAPARQAASQLPNPANTAAAAERDLFLAWQRAWNASETARRPTYYHVVNIDPRNSAADPSRDPRIADLKCRFDYDHAPMYVPDFAWGRDPGDRKIESKTNERHWVCPNWLPPPDYFLTGPHLPDERLGIDAALEPKFRARIDTLRRGAIRSMERVAQWYPSDSVPIGQLVRLLVDQRSLKAALDAAHGCRADRAWCASLMGYVLHLQGNYAAAAASFSKAASLMGERERCAGNDVGPLLDKGGRAAYSHMTCPERDSVNARVWWLADPLWSEPGNDRQSEQFARHVIVALHSALGRDERYDWSAAAGGDALGTMILRYGWPSYTYTGGATEAVWQKPPPPLSGGLYMPGPPIALVRKSLIRPPPSYQSTYEYSIGRIHIVPSWSMISDPFGMKSSEWSVNAPSGEWEPTLDWWPQEHYAPAHPLVEIMDQQTAQLRRQDYLLFAYATNLARTQLNRHLSDSVDASFVVSTAPSDINLVTAARHPAFGRLVFLEPVPLTPSIVSVEVMWDSAGGYAGRSRFGVKPAPPLSAMNRGEYAISEPVLLAATANSASLPNNVDSAVANMLGSTTLTQGTSAVGVYWETYGFNAGDSVEVSVTVQPRAFSGLLRIVGAALGVTSNLNAPVSVTWKEPQSGHDTRTIASAVPIQMRSVILNISTLAPGAYTLAVAVNKPGQPAARSTRDFLLR